MILKMRICFLVRSRLLEKKKVLFVIRSVASRLSQGEETCEKENVSSSGGPKGKKCALYGLHCRLRRRKLAVGAKTP